MTHDSTESLEINVVGIQSAFKKNVKIWNGIKVSGNVAESEKNVCVCKTACV